MRTDRAVSDRVANKDEHVDRVSIRPIVDRILDTRLWKYYLGPTSLRPVNISYLQKLRVEVDFYIGQIFQIWQNC